MKKCSHLLYFPKVQICSIYQVLKWLPLIFLVLAFSIPTLAQQEELATIVIPYKDVNKLIGAADSEGNICVFYQTGDNSFYSIFDKDGKLLNTISFPVNESYKIDDILYTQDEFCVYYSGALDKNRTTNLLKISKKEGGYESFLRIPVVKGNHEKKINSFSIDNQLFYVGIDKKANSLALRIFNGSDVPKALNVDSKMTDLYDHFKKENPIVVKQNQESTIYQGHFRNKAFMGDSILYFIYDGYDFQGDGNRNNTEILKVDIKNNSADYKLIKLPRKFKGEASNSFLVDNMLFRLTLSQEHFDLSIYSLHSLELLKQHSFNREDDFYLKDGLLIKEGDEDNPLSTDIYKDDNTSVFKYLNKGTPSIVAQKMRNSRISLQIGCYQEPAGNVGGASTFTPGQTMSTPYGTVSTPSTWHYSPSLNYNKGEGISIYFKSALSISTLEKSGDNSSKYHFLDRAIKKLQNSDIKLGNMTVFSNDSEFYIAYVDRKRKEIVIQLISNKFGF